MVNGRSATSSRNSVPPSAAWNRPSLSATGAGEAALLVAEELAFHEFLRDRAAIHRHECLVRPRTLLMNHARHQLLAGTRFTADVNGCLAAGELGNRIADIVHGRGIADEAAIGDRRPVAQLQCGTDQVAQNLQVHRLGDEIEGAGLQRFDSGPHVAVGRDHGHRNARVVLVHVANEIDAVAVGQPHIRETEIERQFLGGRVGVTQVGHRGGGHVHAFQGDLDELADIGLIVHHQCAGPVHVGSMSCRPGWEKVMRNRPPCWPGIRFNDAWLPSHNSRAK